MAEPKSDDEITIDAKKSKISGISENSDEEFSIDFSKITKFFKSEKKEKSEKEETEKDEGDIEIDFSKVTKFFKGDKKEEREETKKEDEEISIDFSGIKKFFKGKKKEETEKEESEGEDEEEISFDLSSVKKIFKRKKEKGEEKEEISINWGEILQFIKKYRILFLLLIPLFLSVFMRIQPAYLPVTDQWATSSVMGAVSSQIRNQVNQQYPNLPDANKDALVNENLQNFIKQQKSQIDQQIAATSNFFKSQLKDDKGNTYLLAIDPYFWMRHAKNVVEKGTPADEIRNGEPRDTYMHAPIGRRLPRDMFHAYFEGYLFKFLRFFNRDLELMRLAFFMPIIVSALAVIPAFFITRRIAGNFGGFFAATMIAVHSAFLNRTAGGFADTDAYNVTFPLFIAWALLSAFEAKDIKKKILLGGLTGFLIGLYSFTWGGWWYIFDFILIALVAYLGYYILVYRDLLVKSISGFFRQERIRNVLLLILIFIISSGLFITLFVSFNTFKNAPIAPIGFNQFKAVAVTTVWPNVFTTVAEQNPSSLPSVINNIGGKFLFFLSMLGIILTMLKKHIRKGELLFFSAAALWYLIIIYSLPSKLNTFLLAIAVPIALRFIWAAIKKDKDMDVKYAFILIIWFIGTIFASVRGVRFLLLLVPAFSIGIGIFAGDIYRIFSKWFSKGLNISDKISKVTVLVLLLLLLINPIKSSYRTALNEVPSMNDAWYESLDKINREAAPDAIINSWWDFGHWFKMIGNRAVTFDGTSQNSPMAYWIGRSLLISDEKVSVGILRMLDCGSNSAFEELNKKIQNEPVTIDLLNEIIILDRDEAFSVLRKRGLSEEEAESVLKFTHCEPPENYYITSEDMIGKSGVWGHFGSWNFWKASMYNKVIDKDRVEGIRILKEEFNLSESESQSTYVDIQTKDANNWIAPWPSYQGGLSSCNVNNEMVVCGNGVIVNLTEMSAFVPTQEGIRSLNSLTFANNSGVYKREFKENTVGVSAALIPNGDSYRSILTAPQQADSIFTRLFYFKGHGSKYFDLFSYQRSMFGSNIYVWKVDWDGKDVLIVDEFVEKTMVGETDEVFVNYIAWYENGSIADATIKDWQNLNLSRRTRLDDSLSYDELFVFSTDLELEDVPEALKKGAVGMEIGDVKIITVPKDAGFSAESDLANKTVYVRLKVEKIK